MDYHIHRRVRFSLPPESTTLYGWSIAELGENGEQIGSDKIPWDWTLNFTANEVSITDVVDIRPNYEPHLLIGNLHAPT